MNRLPDRVVTQFGAAVGDQVLLSGANFLAGFILIRFTSSADYGTYVLIQSALLLLTSMQVAWLVGPMAVVASWHSGERQQIISSITLTQRRVVRLVVLPLLAMPFLGYLAGLTTALIASLLTLGVLAAWLALRRDLLRGVLLCYSRPHSLVLADAFYCVALLAGVALGAWTGHYTIIIVTVTLGAAAWLGAAVAHRQVAKDPGWSPYQDIGPVWRELRPLGMWSLIGSILYWLFAQSYNFVLVSRLDLVAVTNVNTTRLVLMPVIVMTVGISALLTPTAATWYAEMGLRRLIRRLLLFILGFGLLDLTYFAVMWVVRGWLIGDFLRKQIADRDELLILWAGVAFIGLARDVLQCALFAMGQQKNMAWQVGISAAVALLIAWFGLPYWGAPATLIGQTVGELINLAGIIWLLMKGLRRHRQ